MRGLVEAPEHLDIQVQEIAVSFSFVTVYWLWRREATEPDQAHPLEGTGHGGAWEIEYFTNLICGQAHMVQPDVTASATLPNTH